MISIIFMVQKKVLLFMGNVFITGGTSGLGYELVKHFLNEGNNVFTTGRDSTRLKEFGERVNFFEIRLSDLADVRKVTDNILNIAERIDIVINNAGALSPPAFTTTKNSIEYAFQVNFLSHLLLDDLIIRRNSFSGPLLIVSVTSPVYKYLRPGFNLPGKFNYNPFRSYAESKFYLVLTGGYLKRKYPGKNITHIGFDPGTFSSGISRTQKIWFRRMYHFAAPFMRRPENVASVLAGILEENELKDGVVYRNKSNYRIPNYINDEVAENFMKKCYEIIEPFL
jgi:NAD(P)-dependent dehydrogenase (short-subunit alcohol dehydrogenase family)